MAITVIELDEKRRARWQRFASPDGAGSTLQFIEEAGFAVVAPLSERELPQVDDCETELAKLQVVELTQWRSAPVYVPVEILGYVYVCVGDRKAAEDYRRQSEKGKLSWLGAEVYDELLRRNEPVTTQELRRSMGPERTSALGLEHALAELALSLKVVRRGRQQGDPVWQALVRALPEVVQTPQHVSKVEAAAALITRWLGTMLVDSEENMAAFFSPLMPATRVHSALAGLSAGREVALESLDGRQAYRLA